MRRGGLDSSARGNEETAASSSRGGTSGGGGGAPWEVAAGAQASQGVPGEASRARPYASEELSEWDLVGAEPGTAEPQPSAQAADSTRESASVCGSVLRGPLVGASRMAPREVGLEHQPCSAASTILLGSAETREHHQTTLPGAAPAADVEAALAFAQLFPLRLRQQSLAATGRGDSLRTVVQSLLRQLEGEPASSPRSSGTELATPTAELREGSRGPPREDGLCVCGRTLSHGGGRVHARCCSHCCEGTHSSSCQKRERRRQQERGRRIEA